ncbi:MAG: hypothetical protein IKN99_02595 [Bacteroidales bacterium]|jgi:CHASE3 domain sensor protein|nr:hypothetical protein [Bacteroidales bacterium]MBR3572122.1 hypothetical protein [Bacteroidales bacterium]
MKSTTHSEEPVRKEKRGLFKVLKDVFGGEFLLSRQMLRWYPYIALVFVLMAVMIISEQRIQDKKRKITRLENQYKAELSRLKANNQFIPYEENQILIQKMQERGYVLNEEQNYTIRVKRETPKRRGIFKKNKNVKR